MQTSIESIANTDNKENFLPLLELKCSKFSDVLLDVFDRLIDQKIFYHNQYTTWVHVMVSFILICEGGLTLPLYVYPLKAGQIKEEQGDDALKEQSELLAAHFVLLCEKLKFD